jgi:hypothetical protein
VPRSIYEGARDMARQIAGSCEGRTARRLRKKVEMLFARRRARIWEPQAINAQSTACKIGRVPGQTALETPTA